MWCSDKQDRGDGAKTKLKSLTLLWYTREYIKNKRLTVRHPKVYLAEQILTRIQHKVDIKNIKLEQLPVNYNIKQSHRVAKA